ncbi:MAG: 1-acyl-sn-glycerol-3-phosphate acyltransferase [Alphaproteobacteria bacterium]|nr:1-acyl-sn-glycerol-3-phosphate acyltransferase [Alphaproteobacteria bacterium]
MITLRAAVFNAAFYLSCLVIGIAVLPGLLLPRGFMQGVGKYWSRYSLWLLKVIVGTRWEIRGSERIPKGPAIFAIKHQSAWDTLFFPAYLGNPAMIAKKELRLIPFYGWYSWRAGTIWVDRKRGPAALRELVRGARAALDEGRVIAVFPQGTRTRSGQVAPYQPGIAALYAGTDAPVVPVALNSGLFWPRRGFVKRPGTIVVEFLDPIPPGLSRAAFMETLQHRIDTKTAALEAEAGLPPPIAPEMPASAAGPRPAAVKDVVDNSVD